MNTTAAKRPRGRNAPEAKLEQFSIRLPPKHKLGLDALAHLQGRSLSGAMEWALERTLLTLEVGRTAKRPLVQVLDEASALPGWRRWYAMYRVEPALVPAPERHACAIVEQSLEQQTIDRWNAEHGTPHPQLDQWQRSSTTSGRRSLPMSDCCDLR